MATFTVFSRTRPGDTVAAAEGRVVFVREAFSWLALLFTPLVLLYHRLWMVFAAYVAVSLLMAVALSVAGAPAASVEVVMIGFSLLIAFDLPALRARKLARGGYVEEGVVIAPKRDLAEQRFFAAWTPRRPAPPEALAPRPAPRAETAGLAAVSSVIGTFPGH
ncbi:DUF2628 domain-containing protein [Xanthobacter agilis]|uniref:DUF2628 domain-containing protein n=1 Tax=Xanthobacter agilis TaxID=47492 RepID=A0ABU0L9J7_XANAG|nr:DUF2628 domain-containing protein [Xanthobacter agilis]MDQ0503818.1 hypothetical protein [Xanthobacter agilis]